MTKILLVGDIHVADKPPAMCTDSYTDDIIDMLRWVADCAVQVGADAVVWAGDIFHHKAPMKNSHALVLKMIRVVQYYIELGLDLEIVPGNHDLCVSVDTEALTDQGWRTVDDLDGTEKFATLNRQTGALEFQTPTKIHRLRYTGQGHHFASRSVDLVTTPNHGWWGSWRPGEALRRKTSLELAEGALGWRTPAVESWEGTSPETVKVGTYEIETHLAARLFGWYVSEGTADRSGSRITLSQSRDVNPDHYAEIEKILTDAGLPFSSREKMIRVNDRSVAEFFIEHFGYAGSKDMRLPRWLMEWNTAALTEFLYAYFRGDGTIQGAREVRSAADYAKASVAARTANRALADDLAEVGVRLGYRMTLSGEKEFPFGDYVGHAYSQGFNKGHVNVTLPRPQSVDLDEEMWCPSLPNETWLARRNGKMVWTGNSNDRLESIHAQQPLGVLYAAGAKELHGWHETLPLYGVPWQQDWTTNTPAALDRAFHSWRADPWRFEPDLAISHGARPRDNCLVVTHAPIYPPDLVAKGVPFDLVDTRALADAMGGEGSLYYGHIHEDHGIFSDGGVTFANVGAISRGSLHEYNVERSIKVALWTDGADEAMDLPVIGKVTTLGEPGFIEIPVPHKPASEVFRLEEAREIKAADLDLSQFLGQVGSARVDMTSVASVVAHIRSTDVPEPVKARAIEFLEAVDG